MTTIFAPAGTGLAWGRRAAIACRLVHAGVATELLVVRGAFHGFDLLVPDAEVSQQFSASWKSALRKAFATGQA